TFDGTEVPAHVRQVDAAGIRRGHQIDASPIGVNIRSTIATYSGALDELRRAFARTDDARAQDLGPATSPTTPVRCVARAATAPAGSSWTCSSCPTSTSTAPRARAAATPPPPRISAAR